MNRRDVLKCAAIVAIPSTALPDCRDENGMINPDWEDFECHDLVLNSVVMRDTREVQMTTGRALFGFGNYEDLHKKKDAKSWHAFEFHGMRYKIKVTRLSIDVNRDLGCVVCEVHGRIYS